MATRRKILVIAEAANPEWTSVPLVGWSMAHALRGVADAHIVTQIRNRDAMIRAGLVEGQDFTAIDTEWLASPMWKLASLLRGGSGKGWTTVTAIGALIYPWFERAVWKKFGTAIKRGDYALVHRVTPLSPTAASPIARKCRRAKVPFVLGPLNGGLPWPPGFDAERRKEKEWLSYVRGAYRLLPGRSSTLEYANAIIAGSRHTARELPKRCADRIIYMPENGIDPTRFSRIAAQDGVGPLRLCFIGRLVPYKGADMLLEAALPLLKEKRARLDIVGDGPERERLAAFVARHALEESVTFHGWVEHAEVQDIACRSCVFAFPSIREFGGGAVLEAMALGLVPVVVDYGGPGELVEKGRGFAIPIGPREKIVADLRATLLELDASRERLPATAAICREWAHSRLTWNAKARAMAEIYEWVLAGGERPSPY